MLQFGLILEPTWLDLGRVWVVKMGPGWHQIAPKIYPKIDQQKLSPFGSSQDRFVNDLGPQLGGSRGVLWGSVGRLFGLLSSLGTKMMPRAPKIPQDPSKRPLGIDFRRFWAPTW